MSGTIELPFEIEVLIAQKYALMFHGDDPGYLALQAPAGALFDWGMKFAQVDSLLAQYFWDEER